MQKNLPEGKSLDWYKAEIEKKEQEIETTRSQIARYRQRVKYLRSDQDRVRTHRLIQYGAAFESRFPDLASLSLSEIYALTDSILALPEVQRQINDACFDHILNGDGHGPVSL